MHYFFWGGMCSYVVPFFAISKGISNDKTALSHSQNLSFINPTNRQYQCSLVLSINIKPIHSLYESYLISENFSTEVITVLTKYKLSPRLFRRWLMEDSLTPMYLLWIKTYFIFRTTSSITCMTENARASTG